MGLLVGANIARSGFAFVRLSFNGLMDHALPVAEQALVRAAIEAQLSPGMDYHALRTRVAGSRRFADFHLLVPGAFSVKRAQELSGRTENAVHPTLPGLEARVHA